MERLQNNIQLLGGSLKVFHLVSGGSARGSTADDGSNGLRHDTAGVIIYIVFGTALIVFNYQAHKGDDDKMTNQKRKTTGYRVLPMLSSMASIHKDQNIGEMLMLIVSELRRWKVDRKGRHFF